MNGCSCVFSLHTKNLHNNNNNNNMESRHSIKLPFNSLINRNNKELNAVRINNLQFVIASQYKPNGAIDASDNHGIIMYDTHTNHYSQIIKYPENLEIIKYKMVFNENKNKLFFKTRSKIICYDIKRNKFKPTTIDISNDITFNSSIVSENDCIHIIGGCNSTEHHIYKIKNNMSCEISCYDDPAFDEFNQIRALKPIYVKSKRILLLIGGWANNTIGIWKFCLTQKKWSRIEYLSFDVCYSKAVLSANEQYVFIFGGFGRSNDDNNNKIFVLNNKIFVLDLSNDEQFRLKQSTIQIPIIPKCKISTMVRMGGEQTHQLLVIGWSRMLFKKKQFKGLILPPIYILKMISFWYNQEEIHWFNQRDTDNDVRHHYILNIRHILSSLLD